MGQGGLAAKKPSSPVVVLTLLSGPYSKNSRVKTDILHLCVSYWNKHLWLVPKDPQCDIVKQVKNK